MATPLHREQLSINHEAFTELLASRDNLLIVQDLDGVCMKLVKDPLTRQLSPGYLQAVPRFEHHFFVLTNGEHVGSRGVNTLVDRVRTKRPSDAPSYLPGLAAGGVQWQTDKGDVSHPGVRAELMNFLEQLPSLMDHHIREFFAEHRGILSQSELDTCLKAAILDNKVSPTVNLNVFYDQLAAVPSVYQALQNAIAQLTASLLADARKQGLDDDFFIHYAPNLGQDHYGNEIIQKAKDGDSGTTDFQFMLKGARKEVGLLFLLNQYYGHHTGDFPLGTDFHVLDAPQSHPELLTMIQTHFAPEHMPLIVGVGDTVTSQGKLVDGTLTFFRGGSDRGFLQLIQMIGEAYDIPNLTVYVDSSGGEVLNRKPLKLESQDGQMVVTEGPTDDRDRDDPLRLNVAIPGGHEQYIELFQTAASLRKQHR